MGIGRRVKIVFNKYQWKKCNKHNNTYIVSDYGFDNVLVGNFSYGPIDVDVTDNNGLLKIGSYCSLADGCKFILGQGHQLKTISTFPFKKALFDEDENQTKSGKIVVEDDVWIGYGATILSGVCIGQGAVVAAGAVVSKNVPPYAIVGGIPAKIIKYRFEPDLIKELLKIDYSRLTKEEIEKHKDVLNIPLNNKNQLKWMPKRMNKVVKHD